MATTNTVFIAMSLDGFIADRNNSLEWLQTIPNPDGIDMGYDHLIGRIDAILMGRKTFETVLSFGIDWPYTKPVFVLSSTMESIPEKYQDKIELVKGPIKEVLEQIHDKGYKRVYIDGGTTIQNFLKEDLIDEMIITTIPILLGGGAPLFGDLPTHMEFELVESKVFLNQIVQNHYKRRNTE